MKKVVAVTGYVLMGLMLVGVAVQVLSSLRDGEPFYGVNAWGLPLGTYSSLLVLIIAVGIGLVRVVRILRTRQQRRRR